MHNLTFGLFDDCMLPGQGRILILYSYETESRLHRSGILHYDLGARRFLGPRHDQALALAALDFLARNGRIPADA
jgi:hypothetical protein